MATQPPAGTVIDWEAIGAKCTSGTGSPGTFICNAKPQLGSKVRIRARYTLKGKVCYSDWLEVAAITPARIVEISTPANSSPAAGTTVTRDQNRNIVAYQTVFWLQVYDQNNQPWPSDCCLAMLNISETHVPCCCNYPDVDIQSGGHHAYPGGIFTDILSIGPSTPPVPIPAGFHTEYQQYWVVNGCQMQATCLHWYYDHGERVDGVCAGPCSAGVAPCN